MEQKKRRNASTSHCPLFIITIIVSYKITILSLRGWSFHFRNSSVAPNFQTYYYYYYHYYYEVFDHVHAIQAGTVVCICIMVLNDSFSVLFFFTKYMCGAVRVTTQG